MPSGAGDASAVLSGPLDFPSHLTPVSSFVAGAKSSGVCSVSQVGRRQAWVEVTG